MEYRVITASDMPRIIKYLVENYAIDTPLVGELYTDPEDNKRMCKTIVGEDCGEKGLSVMAIDKETGDIAGVSMNAIDSKAEYHFDYPIPAFKDKPKGQSIYGLMHNVRMKPDLFEEWSLSDIFEIKILSVSRAFRRRGISKDLTRESLKIARSNGATAVFAECISEFSRKAFLSCGMKAISELEYEPAVLDGRQFKEVFDLQRWLPHYRITLVAIQL